MTDWPAAWARLREMDGDEWDAESERLDALWEAAYVEEFVRFALSRRGWTRENAETWASEIVAEAAIARNPGSPMGAAREDVVQCELESE